MRKRDCVWMTLWRILSAPAQAWKVPKVQQPGLTANLSGKRTEMAFFFDRRRRVFAVHRGARFGGLLFLFSACIRPPRKDEKA